MQISMLVDAKWLSLLFRCYELPEAAGGRMRRSYLDGTGEPVSKRRSGTLGVRSMVRGKRAQETCHNV